MQGTVRLRGPLLGITGPSGLPRLVRCATTPDFTIAPPLSLPPHSPSHSPPPLPPPPLFNSNSPRDTGCLKSSTKREPPNVFHGPGTKFKPGVESEGQRRRPSCITRPPPPYPLPALCCLTRGIRGCAASRASQRAVFYCIPNPIKEPVRSCM